LSALFERKTVLASNAVLEANTRIALSTGLKKTVAMFGSGV
jgi:hypothetical protein